MRSLLALFWTGVLVAMLIVTVDASLDRSVVVAARDLWRDPWGRATLFDAYFAFLAVWVWIAWRERTALARGAWLVALLALGNFAIAAYFLHALATLPPGSSWQGLFARRPLAATRNRSRQEPS